MFHDMYIKNDLSLCFSVQLISEAIIAERRLFDLAIERKENIFFTLHSVKVKQKK